MSGETERAYGLIGAFADPSFPPPVRTVWVENRHDWLPFPASIPRHPKDPP